MKFEGKDTHFSPIVLQDNNIFNKQRLFQFLVIKDFCLPLQKLLSA